MVVQMVQTANHGGRLTSHEAQMLSKETARPASSHSIEHSLHRGRLHPHPPASGALGRRKLDETEFSRSGAPLALGLVTGVEEREGREPSQK